ncbi:hypothetical protein [Kineothrix sedimenti]|uniref:Uncharacterized protein n=1 Tax=Kineothrix sedimenti TaxID=3123317 RepID=A0ABZ3F3A5_9FIRM
MDREDFIRTFDRLKQDNPEQKILIDVGSTNNAIEFRIDNVFIYEDYNGRIVLDAE